MNRSTLNHPQSLKEGWLALTGLSVVFLFEMLDNSVLTVALPTIGKELNASVSSLGLATTAYSVVFGSLMLLFGSLADKIGPKRLMLSGLALLGVTSLSIMAVSNIYELIAVRALMGVAAAMTTPLTLSLTFKLFSTESLQLRAMSLISTVGLVGLSIGPTLGGAILTVASWKFLILVNTPIAAIAFVALFFSLPSSLTLTNGKKSLDLPGGIYGTIALVSLFIALDVVSQQGVTSWLFWSLMMSIVVFTTFFIRQESSTINPLIPLPFLKLPMVSSGLLYKASGSVVTAGIGYVVMLQLQLSYHWSPVLAAVGLLPQVLTLFLVGPLVNGIVARLGGHSAAFYGGLITVVGGLTYAIGSSQSYGWIALSLVLISAGVRVNGLVAGMSVFRGLPSTHTSTGSALVDTISQVCSAISIALASFLLSLLVPATIFTNTTEQSTTTAIHLNQAIALSSIFLTGIAATLFIIAAMQNKRVQS
jgi:MFS family permease